MTLATGLVLAIVIGTVAQQSDSLMSFFGSEDSLEGLDDQYTVRAGKEQNLDVLSNDTLKGKVVIVEPPVCGSVNVLDDNTVQYYGSEGCDGDVGFAYCVEGELGCEQDKSNIVRLAVVGSASSTTQTAAVETQPVQQESSQEFSPMEVASVDTATQTQETTPSTAIQATSTVTQQGTRLEPGQLIVGDETVSGVGFGGAGAAPIFTPSFDTSPQETVQVLKDSVGEVSSPVEIADVTGPSQGGAQDTSIGTQQSTGRVEVATATTMGGGSDLPLGTEPSPSIMFTSPAQPQLRPSPTPMLQPVAQAGTAPKGPEVGPSVDSSIPKFVSVTPNETAGQPITAQSDEAIILASLEGNDGLFEQSPVDPVSVNTETASAGAVRVTPTARADSSDIVVELAAQIILPTPQLGTVDASSQTPSDLVEISSDSAFTPNLDTSVPPAEPTQVASAPNATAETPSTPETSPTTQVTADVSCDVEFFADANSGASILVFVSSPCRKSTPVQLEHAGLSFTMMTDEEGVLQTTVPAFEAIANVTVSFADGAGADAKVNVRDAGDMERLAIVWTAPLDLNLHAFENSASEGGEGHVWVENPRRYRDTLTGGGGYLEVFGDPTIAGGTMAEVYTLPVNRLRNETTAEMDLRIDDATAHCGQRMVLRTVRTQVDSEARSREFSLTLPACDVASEGVILESFVENISIARR